MPKLRMILDPATRFMVFGAAAAWLLACRQSLPGTASARTPEDAVYQTVLLEEARSLERDGPLHVVRDIAGQFSSESEAREWVGRSSPMMRRVPEDLLLRYALANREARTISLPARIGTRSVVGLDAQSALASDAMVVRLSRVGFTASGDTALVLGQRTCGPLCGESRLLLLVRYPEGWRIGATLWSAVH